MHSVLMPRICYEIRQVFHWEEQLTLGAPPDSSFTSFNPQETSAILTSNLMRVYVEHQCIRSVPSVFRLCFGVQTYRDPPQNLQ